jgi:hypothetical protein
MTEQDWLACTDPEPMLEFLRGKTTDRKQRLFACACCRHTGLLLDAEWQRMVDNRHPSRAEVEWQKVEATLARRAVEMAEKFADGLGHLVALQALDSSPGIEEMEGCYADGSDSAWAAKASAYRARWCANYCSPRSYPPGASFRSASKSDHDREQSAQCHLLRDIIGNPFRPAALDPAVLAWNDATVARLARSAYDERQMPAGTLDNTRLTVLADALEEAGCPNPEVIGHCRNGGEHVRGCWVLDVLLGKS